MPRFSKSKREVLKRLVMLCVFRNLSTEESLEFIQRSMHVRITGRGLRKIKAELRQDAKNDMASIKQGEFLFEAHQRIKEIKENYRRLLELKDQAQQIENIEARVKILHEIEV